MSSPAPHSPAASAPPLVAPAIALDDVWLKFEVRYYRQRLTLRGAALSALSAALRPHRQRKAREFWALRGLTLSVPEGEILGVVGPNGAGKSTLLRVIAGIYAADRGEVRTRGTVATLLSLGAGFDLRRPGRENIRKNATLLGLSRRDIEDRLGAIIDMAGLGDFIDAPVATYSSGMRARLGFSIAIHADPDVLLIDEAIGAGDEKFRSRVGSIFDQLSHDRKTVVFATHNIGVLRAPCTRALWLDHGQVKLDGPPAEVAEAYLAASRAAS